MRQILFAAGIALAVSILLTPLLIRMFARRGFGQEIRIDGPESHQAKRGTPTMGGVAILIGMWAGYLGSHLIGIGYHADGPSVSGLLVLGLATALGVVGFLDDFIKLRKQRNLGLTAAGKYIGQLGSAVLFGVLALQFRGSDGRTPAQPASVLRPRDQHRVDGSCRLPGLRLPGRGRLVQCGQPDRRPRRSGRGLDEPGTRRLRDHHVLAVLPRVRVQGRGRLLRRARSAGSGAGVRGRRGGVHRIPVVECGAREDLHGRYRIAGPRRPARRIVHHHAHRTADGRHRRAVRRRGGVGGDAGGGIPVHRGNRLFRMAPFHHHFELGKWAETTVIIRFWLLAAIAAAVGLALFYSEYLSEVG